jgi:hypothetical protein
LTLGTIEKSCEGLTLSALHRFAGRKDRSGARTILGSLAHLRIDYSDLSSDSHSRLATQLPTIRSLTHFHGERLGVPGLEEEHYENDETSASLVYLHLNDCRSRPHDLESILRQCTRLQAFVLERGCQPRDPPFLLTSRIVHMLEPVRKGLKCLWLSYTSYVDSSGIDAIEGFVGPVNLVEFHALTSRHIVPKYLVGDSAGEWAAEYNYTTWVANAPLPVYKKLPDSFEVLHILAPEDQVEVELVAQSVRDIIRVRKVRSTSPIYASFNSKGLRLPKEMPRR